MSKKTIPTFDELMAPSIQALKRLGGSASIDELVAEITQLLGLPQEVVEVPHGTTGKTELEYRSAWARTYLRKAGLIENSERGIWALTPEGKKASAVDGRQIARDIKAQVKQATDNESGGLEEPDTHSALAGQAHYGLAGHRPCCIRETMSTYSSRVRICRSRSHEAKRGWRHRWVWHPSDRRIDQFQCPVSEQTVQGEPRVGRSPGFSRRYGWTC